MQKPEEKKRPVSKRPYHKPKIESARFYERKALACEKVEDGFGSCLSGFFS